MVHQAGTGFAPPLVYHHPNSHFSNMEQIVHPKSGFALLGSAAKQKAWNPIGFSRWASHLFQECNCEQRNQNMAHIDFADGRNGDAGIC